MKMKIALDKNSLKNFFIDHVEKIVFGVFVILALLICYFGFASRESISLTPSQLANKAQDAQQNIRKQKEIGAFPIKDYDKLAESSRKEIDEAPYAASKLWRPNLWALQRPRGKPAVLTAEEPNVSVHMVAVGGGGAGARDAKGARFVALTALIPAKKQESAFDDAFRESFGYDPANDVPKYYGFYVQRVEIPSGVDPKDADWSAAITISSTAVGVEGETARSTGAEVVDAAYVLPVMTQPLVALAHGEWKKDVAHEPQIPLLPPKMNAEEGPGGFEGGPPRNTPAARDRRTPTPRNVPRMEATAEKTAVTHPEYQLFRYLDFKVEPGKRYAYRIQLILDNPNYGRSSNLLESADLGKEELLKSEWSAPSSPIVIPPDTRLFAISVKAPRSQLADPSATILLLKWDEETGQEVYKEKEGIERGKLLRFKDEEVKERAAANQPAPAHGSQTLKTDLDAKATVLDMVGGKKLSGRSMTSSGDILVQNFDGSFAILNELDDMAEAEQIKKEPERPAESAEGGVLGPHEGGPPGGATPATRPRTPARPGERERIGPGATGGRNNTPPGGEGGDGAPPRRTGAAGRGQ